MLALDLLERGFVVIGAFARAIHGTGDARNLTPAARRGRRAVGAVDFAPSCAAETDAHSCPAQLVRSQTSGRVLVRRIVD